MLNKPFGLSVLLLSFTELVFFPQLPSTIPTIPLVKSLSQWEIRVQSV